MGSELPLAPQYRDKSIATRAARYAVACRDTDQTPAFSAVPSTALTVNLDTLRAVLDASERVAVTTAGGAPPYLQNSSKAELRKLQARWLPSLQRLDQAIPGAYQAFVLAQSAGDVDAVAYADPAASAAERFRTNQNKLDAYHEFTSMLQAAGVVPDTSAPNTIHCRSPDCPCFQLNSSSSQDEEDEHSTEEDDMAYLAGTDLMDSFSRVAGTYATAEDDVVYSKGAGQTDLVSRAEGDYATEDHFFHQGNFTGSSGSGDPIPQPPTRLPPPPRSPALGVAHRVANRNRAKQKKKLRMLRRGY